MSRWRRRWHARRRRHVDPPHVHHIEEDRTCACGAFLCWCGDWITDDDLDDGELPEGCGGTGMLECQCGGEFCVCHWHGEVSCMGCADCDEGDDFDDDAEAA